jgi:hypothetical protein
MDSSSMPGKLSVALAAFEANIDKNAALGGSNSKLFLGNVASTRTSASKSHVTPPQAKKSAIDLESSSSSSRVERESIVSTTPAAVPRVQKGAIDLESSSTSLKLQDLRAASSTTTVASAKCEAVQDAAAAEQSAPTTSLIGQRNKGTSEAFLNITDPPKTSESNGQEELDSSSETTSTSLKPKQSFSILKKTGKYKMSDDSVRTAVAEQKEIPTSDYRMAEVYRRAAVKSAPRRENPKDIVARAGVSIFRRSQSFGNLLRVVPKEVSRQEELLCNKADDAYSSRDDDELTEGKEKRLEAAVSAFGRTDTGGDGFLKSNKGDKSTSDSRVGEVSSAAFKPAPKENPRDIVSRAGVSIFKRSQSFGSLFRVPKEEQRNEADCSHSATDDSELNNEDEKRLDAAVSAFGRADSGGDVFLKSNEGDKSIIAENKLETTILAFGGASSGGLKRRQSLGPELLTSCEDDKSFKGAENKLEAAAFAVSGDVVKRRPTATEGNKSPQEQGAGPGGEIEMPRKLTPAYKCSSASGSMLRKRMDPNDEKEKSDLKLAVMPVEVTSVKCNASTSKILRKRIEPHDEMGQSNEKLTEMPRKLTPVYNRSNSSGTILRKRIETNEEKQLDDENFLETQMPHMLTPVYKLSASSGTILKKGIEPNQEKQLGDDEVVVTAMPRKLTPAYKRSASVGAGSLKGTDHNQELIDSFATAEPEREMPGHLTPGYKRNALSGSVLRKQSVLTNEQQRDVRQPDGKRLEIGSDEVHGNVTPLLQSRASPGSVLEKWGERRTNGEAEVEAQPKRFTRPTRCRSRQDNNYNRSKSVGANLRKWGENDELMQKSANVVKLGSVRSALSSSVGKKAKEATHELQSNEGETRKKVTPQTGTPNSLTDPFLADCMAASVVIAKKTASKDTDNGIEQVETIELEDSATDTQIAAKGGESTPAGETFNDYMSSAAQQKSASVDSSAATRNESSRSDTSAEKRNHDDRCQVITSSTDETTLSNSEVVETDCFTSYEDQRRLAMRRAASQRKSATIKTGVSLSDRMAAFGGSPTQAAPKATGSWAERSKTTQNASPPTDAEEGESTPSQRKSATIKTGVSLSDRMAAFGGSPTQAAPKATGSWAERSRTTELKFTNASPPTDAEEGESTLVSNESVEDQPAGDEQPDLEWTSEAKSEKPAFLVSTAAAEHETKKSGSFTDKPNRDAWPNSESGRSALESIDTSCFTSYDDQRRLALRRALPQRKHSNSLTGCVSLADRMAAFSGNTKKLAPTVKETRTEHSKTTATDAHIVAIPTQDDAGEATSTVDEVKPTLNVVEAVASNGTQIAAPSEARKVVKNTESLLDSESSSISGNNCQSENRSPSNNRAIVEKESVPKPYDESGETNSTEPSGHRGQGPRSSRKMLDEQSKCAPSDEKANASAGSIGFDGSMLVKQIDRFHHSCGENSENLLSDDDSPIAGVDQSTAPKMDESIGSRTVKTSNRTTPTRTPVQKAASFARGGSFVLDETTANSSFLDGDLDGSSCLLEQINKSFQIREDIAKTLGSVNAAAALHKNDNDFARISPMKTASGPFEGRARLIDRMKTWSNSEKLDYTEEEITSGDWAIPKDKSESDEMNRNDSYSSDPADGSVPLDRNGSGGAGNVSGYLKRTDNSTMAPVVGAVKDKCKAEDSDSSIAADSESDVEDHISCSCSSAKEQMDSDSSSASDSASDLEDNPIRSRSSSSSAKQQQAEPAPAARAATPPPAAPVVVCDDTDELPTETFLTSFEEQRKLAMRRNVPARSTSNSLKGASSLADRMKAFQRK